MMERIFAKLGEDAALGADDLQWILYRARKRDLASLDRLSSRDWMPIAFVRGSREILARNLREKLGWEKDRAASALASLPDTFDAWKAAQSATLTEGKARGRPGGHDQGLTEPQVGAGQAGFSGEPMNGLSQRQSPSGAAP